MCFRIVIFVLFSISASMAQEPQEYLDFILPLIKEAGKELLTADNYQVEHKKEVYDLVTIYDRRIEDILINKIKKKYPNHKFIGEEESEINGISNLTDTPTWIIDPIDGTSNFVRQIPFAAISVGLVINKEQTMGVVYNPFLNECFTAIKGEGAYLNGNKIKTNGQTDINKTCFTYELSLARNEKYGDMYMYRLKHLTRVIPGIRSYGSATISLCYVAAGRIDAYQCDGLYPWDAAAGVLIVREAGGYVCDSNGGEFNLMDPNYLATSTKKLSDEIMAIERIADEERIRDAKAKTEG
ncbi:unnamed protein product [Phaedon cochleariae]|uniref:Inositol-1-monophosphatase n=1 Tax=Phaedon cochleariae TaxID=80249 RepID=A0A9P0GQA8_PHACE|nr:unnamed protein product [Phaedon cochleariae]